MTVQDFKAADCGRMVKKSRIALRPRISALSPPGPLADGTRDMSFAAMPSKDAFRFFPTPPPPPSCSSAPHSMKIRPSHRSVAMNGKDLRLFS